jgi:c-di-AMP phosphodiesterase-like protein
MKTQSVFFNYKKPNRTGLYIICFIFTCALTYFQHALGFLSMAILVLWMVMDSNDTKRYRKATIETLDNYVNNLNAINNLLIQSLPVPTIMLENNSKIIWYNTLFFSQVILGEEHVLEQSVQSAIPNFNINQIMKEQNWIFRNNGCTYRILSNHVSDSSKQSEYQIYYLVDHTKEYNLLHQQEMRESVFCYLMIDNYSDIMDDLPSTDRHAINAAIDSRISQWSAPFASLFLQYDSDRYLIVLEREKLQMLKESRFSILDDIREIKIGNIINATLSIGVGVTDAEEYSLVQSEELAKSALDVAVARGGDQAVIKDNDKLTFYGGKSEAVEKRTKVKARLKAFGLQELISDAKRIFIMGHKNPDMDALGSAAGLYGACKTMDKKVNIVLAESNPSITSLYNYLKEDKTYEDAFIDAKDAERMITPDSLIIVLDVQRKSIVEAPELLEKSEKVIVIDHHRRAGDYIDNAILSYTEPYASSTCELVTELLQHFDNKDTIPLTEANALLVGMFMDTKMFTYKTGVRTFEAAAYMRRKGADTLLSKILLQDDLATYTAKAEIVTQAEIYKDHIALSSLENSTEHAYLIAAQAADELLGIKKVKASFVMVLTESGVIISGRSLGEISVQRILEKLGGGGHLTVSGAQLETKHISVAKKLLTDAIEEYNKEEETKNEGNTD